MDQLRRSPSIYHRVRCYMLQFLANFFTKFAPKKVGRPGKFWDEILQEFTLGFSNQQLLTSLLVLIVTYIKYAPGLGGFIEFGTESSPISKTAFANLLYATDSVYVSSITHLASMRALMPYIRRHRKLTIFRITMVFFTYAFILGTKIVVIKASITVGENDFLALQILQIIGMAWIYCTLVLKSISLHDTALDAREGMAELEDESPAVRNWIHYCDFEETTPNLWRFKQLPNKFLLWAARKYESNPNKPVRYLLWVLLEIVVPWRLFSLYVWFIFALGMISLGTSLQGFNTFASKGGVDIWGLGQLLPLLMLALPMLNLGESYIGKIIH
jgi:hypothetical protein